MGALLKTILLFCAYFIQAHCSITTSYSNGACPGFETFTCTGMGIEAEWSLNPNEQDFVFIFSVTPSRRLDTHTIRGQTATAVYTPNGGTENFTSTLSLPIDSSLERASLVCRTINLEEPSVENGRLLIHLATLPSPPTRVKIRNQKIFSDFVSVTLGWSIPDNTGGADIVSYTVVISPPTQLSATVVTSTSVTVPAADYNTHYTVSVVATNCVGGSLATNYSFTVGRCPIPLAPEGGLIGIATNRVVNSTVTFGCDFGYTPTQLMVATCLSTLMWGPDPAMFMCRPTGVQGAVKISKLQLAIGVGVTFVLSSILGVSLGVCGACFYVRRRNRPLAMDKMNKTTEPPDYAIVEPSSWEVGANLAYRSIRH